MWIARPISLSEGLHCTEASSKSLEHHATFVYGANGLANQWNYRGTRGERSSKDLSRSRIVAHNLIFRLEEQLYSYVDGIPIAAYFITMA